LPTSSTTLKARARRCADEDIHSGLTRSRNLHRSNGAALGAGVNAMRLNRKTQPLVYKRVAIKTDILADERRRAQGLMDLAIGIWGFAFVVFLFAVLG